MIRERGGDRVLLVEAEPYEVCPGHTMLNCGHSNPTPWNTPRELDEETLAEHLEEMAARIDGVELANSNIHVPPFDSGLDTAPQLEEKLSYGQLQHIASHVNVCTITESGMKIIDHLGKE